MTPDETPELTPDTSQPKKRPQKPYPDFPLFPHASGRWAKKIRGKLHYFGPWRDWQAALDRFLEEKDYLYSGRKPPAKGTPGRPTLGYAVNQFLAAKERAVASGDLVVITFQAYSYSMKAMLQELDPDIILDSLVPADWYRLRSALGATRKPNTMGNVLQHLRTFCTFCYRTRLIDSPLNTGDALRRPPAKVIRRQRHEIGPRDLQARDIRKIVKAADSPMDAIILLAINTGFGNTDCMLLEKSALDLRAGMVHWPRVKTQIPRHTPLWPRTVVAIERALLIEPASPEYTKLVFLRSNGLPFEIHGGASISTAFRQIIDKLGLYRPGIGFYGLRRTFETIAADSDIPQRAIDAVMGHVPPEDEMSAIYRQWASKEQIRRAVAAVHRWLYRVEPEAPRQPYMRARKGPGASPPQP